jgi:hypothetical protein
MTTLIVVIAILGYIGVAIPTSVYARNRSITKSFNSWYEHSKDTNEELIYTKKSDDDLIIDAMKTAKSYDSADWATVAFLSAFFWPAFIVGFTFHAVYKKVENLTQPLVPKTDIEKTIEQIHKSRKLEKERKELLREARRLGLDTRLLEKLGE